MVITRLQQKKLDAATQFASRYAAVIAANNARVLAMKVAAARAYLNK